MSVWRCVLLILVILASTPAAGFACSICYGDPNSLQVKGAEAGVLVLLGVIGAVLVSIAGMILFWTLRARRLSRGLNTAALPVSQ